MNFINHDYLSDDKIITMEVDDNTTKELEFVNDLDSFENAIRKNQDTVRVSFGMTVREFMETYRVLMLSNHGLEFNYKPTITDEGKFQITPKDGEIVYIGTGLYNALIDCMNVIAGTSLCNIYAKNIKTREQDINDEVILIYSNPQQDK